MKPAQTGVLLCARQAIPGQARLIGLIFPVIQERWVMGGACKIRGDAVNSGCESPQRFEILPFFRFSQDALMVCGDRLMSRRLMCVIFLVCGGTCSGQRSPTAPSVPGATAAAQDLPAQGPPAQGQPVPLPGAPGASVPGASASGGTQGGAQGGTQIDEEQEKRIMGMLPNFRSVTAGQVVPPETTRQKLVTATEDNFDYTSLFFAGVIAADSFAMKATPEFRQGAAGYARYYWHTVADQGIENYSVELILPAITHEDSRYFAMGREGGGFWKRAGYSLSRVAVTKKDSGGATFNASEVAGSGIASSISLFYYPTKEQTVHDGLRDWGLDITYDAITFMFHEFWPDINHALFGKKGKAAVATR